MANTQADRGITPHRAIADGADPEAGRRDRFQRWAVSQTARTRRRFFGGAADVPRWHNSTFVVRGGDWVFALRNSWRHNCPELVRFPLDAYLQGTGDGELLLRLKDLMTAVMISPEYRVTGSRPSTYRLFELSALGPDADRLLLTVYCRTPHISGGMLIEYDVPGRRIVGVDEDDSFTTRWPETGLAGATWVHRDLVLWRLERDEQRLFELRL